MKIARAIIGPFLALLFLSVFVYAVFGSEKFFENTASLLNTTENIATKNKSEDVVLPEKPEINAIAAISVESDLSGANKIIFEKNSNALLPIASLTKLMTAIIVLDNYDLLKVIEIDKISDSQPPMKQDIKLGDKLTVKSLLEIMLIKSSNKSAFALSQIIGEQKFVYLMNKKAEDINLKNTFFVDPTGLSAKNISNASDLAKFAKYILKNYPKIAQISKEKEMDIPGFGKAENTDQLLAEVPEIVCSKTGFTTEAKGCLLLVTNNLDNNNYIINVILGAEDRFSEMKKLINWSSVICK